MAPKASGTSLSTPRMVASSEYEIQNRTNPAKLKRTPEGWGVFMLVFYASMSQPLRHLVQSHMLTGQLKPNDADETLAYDIVWNGLITRLESEPDLITLLARECDTGNGVQALGVLHSKFAGNTAAKSLSVLNEMITFTIDADPVAGAQRIQALNSQLAADEQFTEKLLSALILVKLPSSFANLRDGTITGGIIPSLSSLIDQIEQLAPFVAPVDTARDVNLSQRLPFCYNCNTRGHQSRECKSAPVDCDACGPKAGHLPQYCLVKNGKELPPSFTPAQRDAILAKRDAWLSKDKSIKVAEVAPPVSDDADDTFVSFPSYPSEWDSIAEC